MRTEQLLALGLFLALFFGIGLLAQHKRSPSVLWTHPTIYALAFYGVSGIIFYTGTIEIVGRYGLAGLFGLLAYTMVFIFSPLFLEPLRWISRAQAFSSLPDLLIFRFRSIKIGQLSTLTMAFASLPIAAAQLHSISAMFLPTTETTTAIEAGFLGGLSVVAIIFIGLFCSTNKSLRAIPPVISFGAILALTSISLCGGLAIYEVFGSFEALNSWAQSSGQASTIRRFDNAYALILILFAAPFILPQLTYMQRMAGWWPKNASSSWMLPLILLIATLPVFPILWAGLYLKIDTPLQLYITALPNLLNHPGLYILSLISGLFMGMGLIVVTAIALGKFILTSFITAQKESFTDVNLKQWLNKWHFLAASLWVLLALLFAVSIPTRSLTDLTIVGLICMVQLLPALMATLYLPKINRTGCLAGLSVGLSLWFFAVLLPLFTGDTFFISPLTGNRLLIGSANWPYWLLESLIANLAITLMISRLTHTSDDERIHAHQTMVDNLPIPQHSGLDITSITQVQENLSQLLGKFAAEKEVTRAIKALKIDKTDSRPLAMRIFRDKLSFNLSEKLGTFSTEKIINVVMPLGGNDAEPVDDMSLLETQLARTGGALSGLAAELNKLRLYHRQTLENLPIGVCSIDKGGEILLWNQTIATYTRINPGRIEGANLEDVPQPWGSLLKSFAEDDATYWPTLEVSNRSKKGTKPTSTWFHLHKYRVEENSPVYAGNQIILIEDISERLRLIQELAHSERLTSVGRLAAGVAHEIGNPVTGISCLAQDLESESNDVETKKIAQMILTQTERISTIVGTLIDFSRSDDDSDHRPVALTKAVADAIQLLMLNKAAKPVRFTADIPSDLMIQGDIHQLTQVFVNLLSNARDASPENGLIEVTHGAVPVNGMWLIYVSDQGAGIDADKLDHIMDPFYTTKDPGEGTGLGLSLVYSIIRLHGGTIEITSPIEKQFGTQVTISLKAS